MAQLWPVQTHAEPISLQKERITVDKWVSETQRPRFDFQRHAYLYPADSFVDIGFNPTKPPGVAWLFPYQYPIFTSKRTIDYNSWVFTPPPFIPPSNILWFPETQRPIFKPVSRQDLFPYLAHVITGTEVGGGEPPPPIVSIFEASFHFDPNWPSVAKKIQYLFPSLFYDPFVIPILPPTVQAILKGFVNASGQVIGIAITKMPIGIINV